MKNVLKPLAKNVLIPLGLAAGESATDAAIQNQVFGSGIITLIISNKEMEDITKMIKSLVESGLSIKRVSKTNKNKTKVKKRGFLGMLLGTLGASSLGNLLTGKGVRAKIPGIGEIGAVERNIRAGEGTIRAGEGIIRAGQDF